MNNRLSSRPGSSYLLALPATYFSHVRPEANRWLWRGLIPAGALALVAGDPAKGKSLLTIDWAARVTTGACWPDGKRGTTGTAVFLSPEDDPRRTIVPRFLAAGGDPARACFLDAGPGPGHDGPPLAPLAGAVEALGRLLRQVRDVRLVVVDPLNAYLAGVNTARDGEVRAALGPLIDLSRRHGFAVVGVVHLNKAGGGRAMYRSLGSIGIQGLARASWLVAPDPNGGGDARLMLPVKFNLGTPPQGVAFRLVPAAGRPSVPVVRYDAFDVAMTADEAIAAPSGTPRKRAGDRAAAFLHDLFSKRGKVASAELFWLAGAAGVSDRTLKRALSAAGVETFKDGRRWSYRLSTAGTGT